ncbi:DNA polymerase-3 subunit delta' [Sphingomonas sp. SORGH_AS 950]|uniref:AAA family ATPase n=1 Tax=Sphingomonas sp. SORGH_AS_0950 TaxID=3041792 RepID=UPI002782867E|nr:AAA family ATPase [Sphingomonas sp. SORGH_AS_0950]MDQ1155777.1 DNA polymerase-3 subunit delta' [Sphingomonas sp. SORGH_AS_0950]
MNLPVGNAAAQAAFAAALGGAKLHHAWLLAGPEGLGKAAFARAAARRVLARAGGQGGLPPGLAVPDDHPTARLMEAGSHPDFCVLARLPKDADKPDQDLARSITIAQVRTLQPMFATAPAMGPARVVLIDSIDDLERGGANALLKNLEEPPAGTLFLLVSHAPGRLLPTIRSRCRLLRFERLSDGEVATVLRGQLPEAEEDEIAALVAAADGAPGRALRFAGLDIAGLDATIARIAESGDPGNAERVKLAKALAGKAAQARYEAFLDRVPAFIAGRAQTRSGPALKVALDAYAAAQDLAGAARGLSLDAQGTVFEMAGIIATLR